MSFIPNKGPALNTEPGRGAPSSKLFMVVEVVEEDEEGVLFEDTEDGGDDLFEEGQVTVYSMFLGHIPDTRDSCAVLGEIGHVNTVGDVGDAVVDAFRWERSKDL